MNPYSAPPSAMCFGDSLEEWVMENVYPTEVKECKTRRYVLANQSVASLFGITANAMIGLDINALGQNNKLKASFIERINTIDYEVVHRQKLVRFKHIFFTHNQQILAEEITKQPVFNHKNEVIAILNYTRNITPSIDLLTLFLNYEDLYCRVLAKTEAQAIQAFLQHAQLGCLFVKPPTRKELILLLRMRDTSHGKEFALKTNIPIETVDTDLSALLKKLRNTDSFTLPARLKT